MIVVLVTGSRTWTDAETIEQAIRDEIGDTPPESVLIRHGKCPRGADEIADFIALGNGWKVDSRPAQWDRYGKRAGYIRNAEMVGLGADVCLAFIHNNSRGASMCADIAEKAGIRTRRFIK